MKKLFLFLFVVISIGFRDGGDAKHCPLAGDTQNKKIQQLNALKNRDPKAGTRDTSITLEKILQAGNDTGRFNSNQYGAITGYLYKVKYGGAESCNCHDPNKSAEDYHLEIVQDMNDVSGKNIFICEITWRSRMADSTLTMQYIKSMVGKKIKISGWMFFDQEHYQNAYNTNSEGTDLWRATCWEMHPVINIFQIQ